MKRRLTILLALSVAAMAGCNGGSGLTPAAGNLPGSPNFPGNAAGPAAVAGSASAAEAVLRPYNGPAALASFEWGRAARQRMTFVRPVTIGAMEVDVQVRMHDARGLLQYAQSASNPHSGNYRHFLTPLEIADRYGASETDYKQVAHYFAHLHMRVGMWKQRELLTVTGTLAQLKKAFGTGFGYFNYGRQMVIAPMQTPHFSEPLPVSSVLHLTTYNPARTYYVRGIYSHFAGYPPQMIASGFDYSGAYSAGYNGSGVTLGINGTWAISPADVPALGKLWNASVATVTDDVAKPQPASPANGNTGTGAVDPYPAGLTAPPPITAYCNVPPFPTPPDYNTCNPEDVEAQLDTEQVASLAPGASTLFYIAYNPSICVNPNTGEIVQNKKNGSCPKGTEFYPLMGIQLADDSLQQAIGDNLADTQSLSWGEPENEALAFGYISSNPSKPGVGQIEFASLSAEGIAVFVSSGDDGAWECFDPYTGAPLGIACVSYPASDPNVVAVGGVNAPIAENGVVDGQITAWGDNTTGGGNGSFRNNVGSGGGISSVFPAPPWQAAAVHNTYRGVPDISMDADPATGASQVIYAAFPADTEVFADGGTSLSAPDANAEWGLVLNACSASSACATATGAKPYRLGNPAPLFYAIYADKALYRSTVYDVVYGGNQAKPAATPTPQPGHTPAPFPTPVGYNSHKGYDMVTGIGVPFGGHLIDAIVKGATAP